MKQPEFRLISARDLREMLSSAERSEHLLVVETEWGPPEKYNQGHIPGAVYLDTDLIEADLKHQPRNWWNLLPVAELFTNLGSVGIRSDSQVIVYSSDPLAACRVCWTLMVCGVERVAWLDGGKKAWTDFGGRLETAVKTSPKVDFGRTAFAHPEWLWSRQQVAESTLKSSDQIVDVRSREEFDGKSTGYSYVEGTGKIPGAVWCGSGQGNSGVEDYFQEDGTLKPLEQIADLWRDRGLAEDRRLVFYCGTGWRAGMAFCLAMLMGKEKIAVYDGGWYEWSMRPGSGL